MKYPRVMTERETLEAALAGRSLARFGDGELRLALGGGCSSQSGSPEIAAEFQSILAGRAGPVLACVPRPHEGMGNADSWEKYREPKYVTLMQAKEFGSAFISRPDSAPNIDTPDYWDRVRQFWCGRRVTLVKGEEDRKSLTPKMLYDQGAEAVHEIEGPIKNAYAEIDRIEEEAVGRPLDPVLLCLGACATALAARLARRGLHAIDLGHVGMFMRHAGIYAVPLGDLTSKKYKKQLVQYHENNKWGTGGWKETGRVLQFRSELGANSVLDYGCGRGTLAVACQPVRVYEYDPGIPGKDKLPKPANLVVCADVLEHVEPEKLDGVLRHVWLLAGAGIYLVIAMYPANKQLPDGRDLHLIQRDESWWLDRLAAAGYSGKIRHESSGKELRVWVTK